MGLRILAWFSPLLLMIALAVNLSSPGPIPVLQDRDGLDGRSFPMFKVRTMRVMEAVLRYQNQWSLNLAVKILLRLRSPNAD